MPDADLPRGASPSSVERGPSIRVRGFRPPRWARNPHLQTLLGKALRPARAPHRRRERWPTPDGDFLDVDFTDDPDPGAPMIVVLHGLEGSSRRGYVLEALRAIRARGMAGVALNFRGCSGELNHTPRAYHSGETGDLTMVLAGLRERFPDRPMGAVGFSLGGNVLLKLLGEWGADAPGRLDAAAAVSVPYDLAAGARALERPGWGRAYTRYFLRSLLRKIRERAELLEDHVSLPRVLSSRTLREFDDALTAPLHGFRDADHYYAESSSARYLPDIRVPTLLVHAIDDPFLPSRSLPRTAADENPHVVPAFSPHGGHVGFVEGPPWAPHFWAEDAAAGFLASALEIPR